MSKQRGFVAFTTAEAKALAFLAGHYGDAATAIRRAVIHEAARLQREAAQRQANATQGEKQTEGVRHADAK